MKMKINKKTVFNVLLMIFVLSFFVTPLGHFGKIWLNQLFSSSPTIIENDNRNVISSYDWKLKDANWNFFNFERSKGKVVFINFWNSWHLPSEAQLSDIQDLYDQYKGKVDFYIITNEEREPVETFMAKKKYTFPVTYQIIGEPSPIKLLDSPGSYILDKQGKIAVHQNDISDWNNNKVYKALEELLTAE